MAACVASLLYVPLLASVWPLMKAEFGPGWLFITLCLAFFSDTVAYIFGRLWGRHKLYPAVSPGKTWEGSVGGLVGGVLATAGAGSLLLVPELPIGHAMVLGIVGSLFGQARRPVRVDAQARLRGQGLELAAGGPRRHARPGRRAAVRRAGRLLLRRGASVDPTTRAQERPAPSALDLLPRLRNQ